MNRKFTQWLTAWSQQEVPAIDAAIVTLVGLHVARGHSALGVAQIAGLTRSSARVVRRALTEAQHLGFLHVVRESRGGKGRTWALTLPPLPQGA